MRAVLMLGFAMTATQLALVSYLFGYQTGPLLGSLTAASAALFGTQMAGAVGRIGLASWTDRQRTSALSVARWTLIGGAIGLIALAFLPAATPSFVVVSLVAVLGFFQLGWYGPWVTHIVGVSPPDVVGTTLGIATTANQVGIVVGPPVFGLILDWGGSYRIGWLFFAGFLCLAALLISREVRPDRVPQLTPEEAPGTAIPS